MLTLWSRMCSNVAAMSISLAPLLIRLRTMSIRQYVPVRPLPSLTGGEKYSLLFIIGISNLTCISRTGWTRLKVWEGGGGSGKSLRGLKGGDLWTNLTSMQNNVSINNMQNCQYFGGSTKTFLLSECRVQEHFALEEGGGSMNIFLISHNFNRRPSNNKRQVAKGEQHIH